MRTSRGLGQKGVELSGVEALRGTFAIKDGELYGGTPGISASAASGGLQLAAAGSPLVVIRFDRPNPSYEQALYTAVSRAIERRPDAVFDLVAVSPGKGNQAQVALAWLLAKPYVSSVLLGANKMAQLEDNLGATDLQLSHEELAALDELTAPPLTYPNWFAARVVDPPVRDALSGAGTRKAAQ